MAELLNPLTLPLRGARLIEASAGTGKTWTIAALYLRLVLGHGGAQAAPARPLLPPEILVMTFTRAATRELAERIRTRLAEAAAVLRGERTTDDAFLTALCADLFAGLSADERPDAQARAAYRLTQAAEAMDEAAIHTIDAWCQRVLREHALASGAPMDEELVADEAALRRQAVRDFWRAAVYPLAPAHYGAWHATFADVDALAHAMSQALPRLDALADAAADAVAFEDEPGIDAAIDADRAEVAALKQGWVERAAEMRDWLLPLAARKDKDKPFDGRRMQTGRIEEWTGALADWARAADQTEPPDLTDTAWYRLSPEGVLDALRPGPGAGLTPPPVFDAFAALRAALQARLPLPARLLALATRAVARRVADLKQRQHLFGFADPLRRLDEALAGPAGEALCERLLAQYPVALIDEFQDTSPRQWRVFERIFAPEKDRLDAALLLIGDPKQSIYGFRGADIYSYLRARTATAPRHHALGTNHRATAALVAAVNGLFAQAESRCPDGAFALGKGMAMALPFVPVAAHGRVERLVSASGSVPAVTVCADGAPHKAEALRQFYATLAAEQVVAWLNDPHCGFARDDQPFERLKPADIALLVRSGTEAKVLRAALALRGVPSVYLSAQASVFEAPEATDVLRWLRAVASPLDGRLARAAFASPGLGLSWQQLAAQASDEAAWDARTDLLRELQRLWQRQGVLAMLRHSLHRLHLPARRLAEQGAPDAPGGERSLTNLLHLAELLQTASTRLEGEEALVRWLAERIEEAQGGGVDTAGLGDERLLRLESDAGLVQVVTVHKSKGLEYPVVLLPFAAGASFAGAGDAVLNLVDDAGRRSVVFHPSAADREAAARERLREDLRLLYVALTRARHALWLGVGLQRPRGASRPLLEGSALGWLIGGGQPLEAAAVKPALQQAFDPARLPAGAVCFDDGHLPLHRVHLARDEVPVPLLPPPTYSAQFERDWRVGSYSSVVRGLAAADESAWAWPFRDEVRDEGPVLARADVEGDAVGAEEEDVAAGSSGEPVGPLDDPPLDASADAPMAAAGTPAPWHTFPRGPLPGNFLHDQLQWLAEQGFAAIDQPAVQQTLWRRCQRAGHGARAGDVLAWLQALVHTPLPGLSAPLAAVTSLAAELEFWLPSAALDAPALDALVRQHLLPGVPRPALPARRLHGLLMGFADLVFEHLGRWWVLDYKSNALGRVDEGDSAYSASRLAAAMAEHRYEVQAALYLAALHRLLRARLGAAYDPARHLGGAVYVFLRGIHAPTRGCVLLPAPLGLLDGIDAMLGAGARAGGDVNS
jgi:exodeoxyribonuclease V beta subunit